MATKTDTVKPQRQKKIDTVSEIKQKLTESEGSVLTEYRGLTVDQLAELRASLRNAGTEYKVYKNTLVRRAAAEAGLDQLTDMLAGPVAIAFVSSDTVSAAKAMRDFAKSADSLVIKGGYVSGQMIDPSGINALADLPPREQLLAMLAGAFQAPMQKAAGLFSAMQRNMAYGLAAYVEKRVAQGEANEAPAAEAPAEAPAAEEPAPDAEPPAEEPAPDAEPPAEERGSDDGQTADVSPKASQDSISEEADVSEEPSEGDG